VVGEGFDELWKTLRVWMGRFKFETGGWNRKGYNNSERQKQTQKEDSMESFFLELKQKILGKKTK
jgi:hypothetical protein